MGQNSSSEQGDKPHREGTGGGAPQREKKVNRRMSAQKLGKNATAADPSLSTTSATAQSISQPYGQKVALQNAIGSNTASPENLSKVSSSEQSKSLPKSIKQNESAQRTRPSGPISAAPRSIPMDVPATSRSKPSDYMEEEDYSRTYAPVSVLRPPRLPLPIADVDMPDSPTLPPQHISNADVSVFESETSPIVAGQGMRRQSSMLSNDTQDDDEIGDELSPYAEQVPAQMVPTVISWTGGGEKVYVTGTFANWEKKFRLHRSESEGTMFSTIPLPPGTHHLKFIVDGDMMISTDLPTAVDYTNVLVNYLEVNADEIPPPRPTRRESDRNKAYPAHPPLAPPPEDDDSGTETEMDHEPTEEEIPMGDFRQIIPQALIDMELPDEDPKYQTAATIISDCPGPPSMPLFLGKSVLNGQLPLKDDSSVLPLPNHTVLNHLATSSLKNGVLATSVTTRYMKKYVTTIMYRPVRPPTHTEG